MTVSKYLLGGALALSIAMSAGMGQADTAALAVITDGLPWRSIGPNGREMTLTFTPDGQVRAAVGIMHLSMRWTATDDGMCISGGPGGDKCVTLIQTETGYQGLEDGRVTLQLSR